MCWSWLTTDTSRSNETVGFTPLTPAALQVINRYRSHLDTILCVSLDALHVDLHTVWCRQVLSLWPNVKTVRNPVVAETFQRLTVIRLLYHFTACGADVQLEELVFYFQVLIVIRSLNRNDCLVRVQVEKDSLHVRTSWFHCRDTRENRKLPDSKWRLKGNSNDFIVDDLVVPLDLLELKDLWFQKELLRFNWAGHLNVLMGSFLCRVTNGGKGWRASTHQQTSEDERSLQQRKTSLMLEDLDTLRQKQSTVESEVRAGEECAH